MDELARISELLLKARLLADNLENADVLRYVIDMAMIELDLVAGKQIDIDPPEQADGA